jgi:hypothetical protein
MAKQELTQERLKELLHYDPETGIFTWKKLRTGPKRSVAGSVTTKGYRSISVDGRPTLAHRLAWLYIHGCMPSKQIDHANGVRDDNRLVNLRDVDGCENSQNVKRSAPSSGFTGVYPVHSGGRYFATIASKGRGSIYLGTFATPEEAHQAYLTAKEVLHTFQPTPR